MTVSDLETLYALQVLGQQEAFAVLTELTTEQFTRPVAGSYGSVRNTLVHVLSAEWGWLDRCGGHQQGPALRPGDYPDVESLVETWTKVEEWVRLFLKDLKDEDVFRAVSSRTPGASHGQWCCVS